ncbi:YlmH family RNA-binding protein [Alkaliphilus transvaalensis]|uniref:YlmH family RNA-binding protein n=1 Tax=Alkaliphilus transvaalensis TaxID=114628 RepID=UPI00047CC9A7|nr:YlmH/Sll1252 family protein [Alkaliphilus transvaalensis]
MDKEKLLQHVEDPLLKQALIRILDKVQMVLKNHEVKATDFLTPFQVKYAKNILTSLHGINFFSTGGHLQAERQILVIFPDYLDETMVEVPIVALEARGNINFNSINHRDYLGAILGLGLKREKIGDIILHQNEQQHFCHIIIHEELKDYILFQLEKVGNIKVTLKEIPICSITPPAVKYQEMVGNVASLRLDSVLGLGFKLSRTEAQNLIAKEYVSVNWETIKRNFTEVSEGDVISVRGKGRVEILSIGGTTKSGRVKITFRKPI